MRALEDHDHHVHNIRRAEDVYLHRGAPVKRKGFLKPHSVTLLILIFSGTLGTAERAAWGAGDPVWPEDPIVDSLIVERGSLYGAYDWRMSAGTVPDEWRVLQDILLGSGGVQWVDPEEAIDELRDAKCVLVGDHHVTPHARRLLASILSGIVGRGDVRPSRRGDLLALEALFQGRVPPDAGRPSTCEGQPGALFQQIRRFWPYEVESYDELLRSAERHCIPILGLMPPGRWAESPLPDGASRNGIEGTIEESFAYRQGVDRNLLDALDAHVRSGAQGRFVALVGRGHLLRAPGLMSQARALCPSTRVVVANHAAWELAVLCRGPRPAGQWLRHESGILLAPRNLNGELSTKRWGRSGRGLGPEIADLLSRCAVATSDDAVMTCVRELNRATVRDGVSGSVVPLLANPRAGIRRAAASCIGRDLRAASTTVRALAQGLTDPDSSVSAECVRALAALRPDDPRVSAILGRVFHSEGGSGEARTAAAIGLARNLDPDPRVLEQLLRAIATGDPARAACLDALARYGAAARSVLPRLQGWLDSQGNNADPLAKEVVRHLALSE